MSLRTLLLVACLGLACGQPGTEQEDVAVRVGYVAVDKRSQSPVVVLEELEGPRLLPIWIGFAEARSIAAELHDARSPRPNTHDLAKRLIDNLDGDVERVVVTTISEGVFYALLFVRENGRLLEIDARPSDAIAIALRYQAPVFVREAVFEQSGEIEIPPGERQGI